MYYFKKIISYMDYFEYGEKKKNCGYGKILVKDDEVTVEIHIKGLGTKEGHMCDIYGLGRQRAHLGRLVLDKGTGYYNACFNGMDMDGAGLRIFDVTGLCVSIDDDRYCETSWEWGEVPAEAEIRKEAGRAEGERDFFAEAKELLDQEAENAVRGESAEEIREMPEAGKAEKEGPGEAQDPSAGTAAADNAAEDTAKDTAEDAAEEGPEPEDLSLHKTQIQEPDPQWETVSGIDRIPLQEMLHEDKWEQLCCLYPVCHPFDDGEDYISIAPKDFVILRKEYQNLVSNSFLLHSFYNYHHVILGKTGTDDVYYIGVPGAYLEREKKVAVMFGFEGFAQSARGNDSSVINRNGRAAVGAGAFGYYMRKVEI